MDSIIEGTEQQKGSAWLPGKLGVEAEKPLDHRRLARAIYSLDPLSLIHGVFFAQEQERRVVAPADRPRGHRVHRRERRHARRFWWVKTDYVSTEGGSADKGYGMVPHSRGARHGSRHHRRCDGLTTRAAARLRSRRC